MLWESFRERAHKCQRNACFGEQWEKKKWRKWGKQVRAAKFIIWAGRIVHVLVQSHKVLQILQILQVLSTFTPVLGARYRAPYYLWKLKYIFKKDRHISKSVRAPREVSFQQFNISFVTCRNTFWPLHLGFRDYVCLVKSTTNVKFNLKNIP